MATFSAVLIPTSPVTSGGSATRFNGSIAAGSTASVVLGNRTTFTVTVNGDSNIEFGNASKVPTASATSLPIWSKTFQEWDTGEEFDRISLFNNTGTAITYWVMELSKT